MTFYTNNNASLVLPLQYFAGNYNNQHTGMEIITRRTPRSKKLVDYEAESVHSKLQFYRYPPTGTLSLQEFEDIALERLKGNVTCQCHSLSQ